METGRAPGGGRSPVGLTALAVAAALAALTAVGCDRNVQVAGPSPLRPPVPTIIAVVVRDGVLLKAQHLEAAQQVEGTLNWTPSSMRYLSFEPGLWWFSATDYEWLMVPDQGHMFFGVWREERMSGDGVLGFIRFQGAPSIDSLSVWVDGHPIEAIAEDKMNGRGDVPAGLLAAAGVPGGARGSRTGPHWFLQGLREGY